MNRKKQTAIIPLDNKPVKLVARNILGRPLKFKSVEDLEQKIADYFKHCEDQNKPKTVSGLALALQCDRVTLLDYSKKFLYFSSIKNAKLIIENELEERFLSGKVNPIAAIFNLKNNFARWNDQQQVKLSGTDGKPIELKIVDNFK